MLLSSVLALSRKRRDRSSEECRREKVMRMLQRDNKVRERKEREREERAEGKRGRGRESEKATRR